MSRLIKKEHINLLRVLARINKPDNTDFAIEVENIVEVLQHYKDLEEQGRLVEVIRCKDCKFFHHGWRCAINGCNTYDDGYCYRASVKLAELKGTENV